MNSEWKGEVPDSPEVNFSSFQYFKLFTDYNIFNEIDEQTNLYPVQKTGKSININRLETEKFTGIHFVSGNVKIPSYKMY